MRVLISLVLGFALGAFGMFKAYDRVIDLFDLETPISVAHGIASHYGFEDGFDGQCMSNGRHYDKGAMTVAHRSYFLGSKVRVRVLGRSVVAIVTDRGPYAKDKKGRPIKKRIIDLSEAAARKLGMFEQGTAPVTVELLSEPEKDETYFHENPDCLLDETKPKHAPKKEADNPENVAINARVLKTLAFFYAISPLSGRFLGSVVCYGPCNPLGSRTHSLSIPYTGVCGRY